MTFGGRSEPHPLYLLAASLGATPGFFPRLWIPQFDIHCRLVVRAELLVRLLRFKHWPSRDNVEVTLMDAVVPGAIGNFTPMQMPGHTFPRILQCDGNHCAEMTVTKRLDIRTRLDNHAYNLTLSTYQFKPARSSLSTRGRGLTLDKSLLLVHQPLMGGHESRCCDGRQLSPRYRPAVVVSHIDSTFS